MIQEDILKIKILEIVKAYENVPITATTKDSFVEEISQEISKCLRNNDNPKTIKDFLEDIDLGKWEQQ